MNIEKLKRFADTIKHCGDYGGLWVDEVNNHIIWVAGDADFDTDEVRAGVCTSWGDVINGFKSLGVEHVEIESEWEPDESDGWKFIGRFGIDNWKESESFWQKHYDVIRLEEIHEKQIQLEDLSDRDKKLLYADIDQAMNSSELEEYSGIRDMGDL